MPTWIPSAEAKARIGEQLTVYVKVPPSRAKETIMNQTPRRIAGLAICLLAAALMIFGALDIGWGAALGVVGIGLLASTALPREDR